MLDKKFALPWLLHSAVESDDMETVARLMQEGADVDAEPATPLIKAACGGYCAVGEVLLQHKADVNKPNDVTNLHARQCVP